jgi:hypothetical protein
MRTENQTLEQRIKAEMVFSCSDVEMPDGIDAKGTERKKCPECDEEQNVCVGAKATDDGGLRRRNLVISQNVCLYCGYRWTEYHA